MKNVLIFGLTANNGGVENFIMNYYRNINSDEIHFDFLVYDNKPCYFEEITRSGSKVFIVPSRKSGMIKNNEELKKFFKKNAKHYDTIWCNFCSLSDVLPLKHAKKYGIKKRIIHSHSSENMGSKLTAILHSIHKKKYSIYATDYFACSLPAAQWMFNDKDINEKKIRIIRNAINTNKFKFDLEQRNKMRKEFNIENKVIIGHVGRFDYAKNHEFLIDVFNDLHSKNPNTMLLSVGNGENFENIKRKIDELNLKDSILLLGQRNDVDKIYQAMDLFLFPSRFEGFPVSGVEAQVSGLACVMSNTITKETDITGNCKFIGLEESKDKWSSEMVEIISDCNYKSRYQYYDMTANSGFDIKLEAKNVENLL